MTSDRAVPPFFSYRKMIKDASAGVKEEAVPLDIRGPDN
jgi:hypothetical protein